MYFPFSFTSLYINTQVLATKMKRFIFIPRAVGTGCGGAVCVLRKGSLFYSPVVSGYIIRVLWEEHMAERADTTAISVAPGLVALMMGGHWTGCVVCAAIPFGQVEQSKQLKSENCTSVFFSKSTGPPQRSCSLFQRRFNFRRVFPELPFPLDSPLLFRKPAHSSRVTPALLPAKISREALPSWAHNSRRRLEPCTRGS